MHKIIPNLIRYNNIPSQDPIREIPLSMLLLFSSKITTAAKKSSNVMKFESSPFQNFISWKRIQLKNQHVNELITNKSYKLNQFLSYNM